MQQAAAKRDRRSLFGVLPLTGILVTVLVTIAATLGAMSAGSMFAAQFGFPGYDYLAVVGIALGAVAGLILIFGPSPLITTLFLVKLITGHQFRSVFVLPLMGAELHPRELWLLLLLAHGAVKLVSGRARIRPDMFHFYFYLYGFYFVLIAAVGVFRQYSLTEVLEECRFPLFLATYFVLVGILDSKREVWRQSKIILWLSAAIAFGGCLFFAWTIYPGEVINTQNVLGEFVRRPIGPRLFQTVRPNGHMFYEICFVVLASFVMSRATPVAKRLPMLALMGLFGCAILVTFMRTAYVALACSLAVLAFLMLPKRVRWPMLLCGVAAAVAVLAAVGLPLLASLGQGAPEIEVSLRARIVEMEHSWQLFTQYPVLGAGMGSTFEAMGWTARVSRLAYGQATFQTLHNVWMYFLLKGGIVGIALVLAALGGLLARAYNVLERMEDTRDRVLMRGLLAATAGQLIASLAMPRLTYPVGAVFLSMMAAAFFLLSRPDTPET